jgi:hypothetical protein
VSSDETQIPCGNDNKKSKSKSQSQGKSKSKAKAKEKDTEWGSLVESRLCGCIGVENTGVPFGFAQGRLFDSAALRSG